MGSPAAANFFLPRRTRVTTLKHHVKPPCRTLSLGASLRSYLMKHRSKVMMHFLNHVFLQIGTIVIFAILFPSTFKAQTRSYTAENLDYVLVLPSAQWRAINVPGIGNDTTEFRYDNDTAVHLRI